MARSGGRGSASWFLTAVFALALAGATGCGSSDSGGAASGDTPASSTAAIEPTGDASTDKLAQVLARGTLILFTDPEVPAAVVHREGCQARARTRSARRTN